VGNNGLDGDNLIDEAARDMFALLWEAMTLPVEEALFCFWE